MEQETTTTKQYTATVQHYIVPDKQRNSAKVKKIQRGKKKNLSKSKINKKIPGQ